MKEERVLSLDISTKTGWTLLVSGDQLVLEAHGQIPQIHEPEGVGTYPNSYVVWAYRCFEKIMEVIEEQAPDVLVIEETSAGSKAIYTQKILEWIHFLVAKFIREYSIKVIYLMTEQWRRETGCKMSKEESKHNKLVKNYKKKNASKIAYDEAGKRIGRLTRKHINIRRANEIFGQFLPAPLRKKDEDTADALMLGYCYHLRRMKNEQQRSLG
jgi:Holliday junction resolvasome RuvABC endonuclease subunit